MRRVGFWIVVLGLAGCSSQTAPPAAPATEAPPTPPVTQKSVPKPPDIPAVPITPTSITLEASQLKEFFTELGKRAGHGGWKPDQIDNLMQNLGKIKKGEAQSGGLHIDHDGGHEDVTMKVERVEPQTFRISFSGGSASLFDSLRPVLDAFDKKTK